MLKDKSWSIEDRGVARRSEAFTTKVGQASQLPHPRSNELERATRSIRGVEGSPWYQASRPPRVGLTHQLHLAQAIGGDDRDVQLARGHLSEVREKGREARRASAGSAERQ